MCQRKDERRVRGEEEEEQPGGDKSRKDSSKVGDKQ